MTKSNANKSASAGSPIMVAAPRNAGRRRFWRDRKGGVLVIYGIALPVLLGFVGLGVETGVWYVSKRDLQTQADAAAIGAAWQIAFNNAGLAQSVAVSEAVRNGFEDNDDTTYTVNNPPASGPNAGSNSAVEVILAEQHNALFSVLVHSNDTTVRARSVATIESSGETCTLALNPTASQAINNTGNSNLYSPSCTQASNSSAADAVSFSGSSIVTIDSVYSAGGFVTGGNTTATLNDPADTNMWPIPDPYATLDPDPGAGLPAGCDINANQVVNGVANYGPAAAGGNLTICANMIINNGATVDFAPGTYWMKGSNLSIQGGTVTCSACEPGEDGVTFIFTTPDNGNVNQIGTVSINGGAIVVLNAPSTGTYQGLLFFQDADAPTQVNNSASLNGGAGTILNGVFYYPSNNVSWSGNVGLAATCTLIVADTVTYIGNSGLSVDDCSDQGIDLVYVQQIVLSE